MQLGTDTRKTRFRKAKTHNMKRQVFHPPSLAFK